MKKTVSLLLCLALGCLALSGCSQDGGEPFEARDYTPSEPVSEVSIDVRDREIEVSPSADGEVHISCFESGKEFYDISVADGVLTMTAASGKEPGDYIGVKPAAEYRKISLQVPDALLGRLTISTTNGDVTVQALTAGNVDISSNGGNISLDGLDVGESLALSVKNGNVTGTVVGGYDDFTIDSEVKKGDCNLPEHKPGGGKTLSVSANNGDIDIELRAE